MRPTMHRSHSSPHLRTVAGPSSPRLVPVRRVSHTWRVEKSQWPNALSITRMVLMPVVLAVAVAGERGWFTGLFLFALFTDFLDGYLARRLNAYSELGRRLDSFADYLTLFVGLASVTLLWPDVVRREWGWFAAVIGSFFGAMLFTTWRLGRAPCYHTWLSKAMVTACVVALVPLFAGWTATPAHLVAAVQVIVALEEVVIACLVPWHVGEVPTAWHAWRMRQARRSLTGLPAGGRQRPDV